MSAVTISVIVPCYDQAQYLPETLDSLIAQTYANWECIIVNDGSHDNTEEVALTYCQKDVRFKYLKKKNGGLSSARNAGINAAFGEYILPLDADDLIAAQYIEQAIKIFNTNPNVKLVYCNAQKFGLINAVWDLKKYAYQELLIQNIIFCSAIFSRSAYKCTNGYDELMQNGYEDWEFWIQLLSAEDIVYQIPEIGFFYRIKTASSIYTDEFHETEKRKYIYKKHIDKYLKYLPDPIFLANENRLLKALYKNSYDYKIGRIMVNPLRILLNKLKR